MTSFTLNAFDRENLAALIPPQTGSIDEMTVAALLRREFALTADEKAAIEYTVDPMTGAPRWSAEKAAEVERDFDLSETQTSLIGKGFALLAAEGRLPTAEAFFTLYEKFAAFVPASPTPPTDALPV